MLKRLCPIIDWKKSFLLSAFAHSLGLSSLLAMSVPSNRSLAFRHGKSVIETVAFVASLSHDASDASDAVSISRESPHVVKKDRGSREPLPLDARDLELPYAKNRSIQVPTLNVFEASKSIIDDIHLSIKKVDLIDERDLEIATTPECILPKPTVQSRVISSQPVYVPDSNLRDAGAVENESRHPLPTNKPPAYPLFELQNGIEGRVVLRLTVEPDGRVSAVGIEESSGVEGLDRAASTAVSKWLFEPLSNITNSKPESLLAPIAFRIRSQ